MSVSGAHIRSHQLTRPPGVLRRIWSRVSDPPVQRYLHHYRGDLEAIARRADALRLRSDGELGEARAALSGAVKTGRGAAAARTELFALVREAARRELGLWAHEEQVLAALSMARGRVAELPTGEGKTLAAVFTASWLSLTGRGVHVLTFNDYLAGRDAAWMGPVYERLGISVAAVRQGLSREARRGAYAADVTYATAKEVGFDHLRDGLRLRATQLVQRPLYAALVDEADSLLVDEARIPLVIAGLREDLRVDASVLDAVARDLEPGVHFEIDQERRNVHLTGRGLDRAAAMLGSGPLHDPENLPLLAGCNLALHARALLARDVDYIVRDGRIEHVDEFTGRVVEDRRWPDGLQAALEAKEGLAVHREGEIRGTISIQHLLQIYPFRCGMTATAAQAADELKEFYGMGVTVVPGHRPCIREDAPDRIYATRSAKERAVVAEVASVHARRQPVLVGTRTVAESERLAAELARAQIPCQVLNARHDAREAQLVAEAGDLGAVTIATNMAGRGTDIRLGGPDQRHQEEVARLGGLQVIGTNRHESRRIDLQLRGRAGRQGDPGRSIFFISLQDDLFERYGGEPITAAAAKAARAGGSEEPLRSRAASRAVAEAQGHIELQNLEIRRTLYRFSTVLERQRLALREMRDRTLHEPEALSRWQEAEPARHAALVSEHGEAAVQRAEQRITLYHLDEAWADHLARVAEVREGIHLHGMAGPQFLYGSSSPLEVFEREVSRAFRDRLEQAEAEIRETCRAAVFTAGALDAEATGLSQPGATWTYEVNEYPLGGRFGHFFKGLQRVMGKQP